MAQNALNELKFGPDMYFYEFYQKSSKNFQNLPNFGGKKVI